MTDPQAQHQEAAAPPPAAKGKAERVIVVWKPEFETATYKNEIVESTRVVLAAKAPWVVEGRKLELKQTAHKEIYRKCNHWLSIHWSRKLQNPKVSVVVLLDSVWSQDKAKFDAAVKAVAEGNPGNTGRPTHCIFGVETTEEI